MIEFMAYGILIYMVYGTMKFIFLALRKPFQR